MRDYANVIPTHQIVGERPRQILVVEDDPSLLDLYSLFFQTHGIDTHTRTTVKGAFHAIREAERENRSFGLYITDGRYPLGLDDSGDPRESPYLFVQGVRAMVPSPDIVLITGLDDREAIARDMGIESYLKNGSPFPALERIVSTYFS